MNLQEFKKTYPLEHIKRLAKSKTFAGSKERKLINKNNEQNERNQLPEKEKT